MQTTGPYTLTLGNPLTIEPPSAVTGYTAALVANLSTYACQISASSGPAQWLQPFSTDLYPLSEGGNLTVTPAVVVPGPAQNAEVLVTWCTPADGLPPGTYPVSLPAQAVINTPSTRIAATGQISVPFETFSTPISVNLQPGDRSIVFLGYLVTGHAQFTNLEILLSGNESLINWTGNDGFTTASIGNPIAAVNSFEPLTIPVYGVEDSTVQLELSGFGSIGGTALVQYVILALPDAILAGSQPNPYIIAQQNFIPSAEGLQGIMLGSLVAGLKDTPVSILETAIGLYPLTPAPPASALYRVGNISFQINAGAAGSIALVGTTSGTNYASVVLPAAPSGLVLPFDAQVNEGLSVNTATFTNFRVSTYYREIAFVPNLI